VARGWPARSRGGRPDGRAAGEISGAHAGILGLRGRV